MWAWERKSLGAFKDAVFAEDGVDIGLGRRGWMAFSAILVPREAVD